MLQRRAFLAALIAGTLPRVQAATPNRKYQLGFLGIGTADDFYDGQRKQLLDALASLGYVSGRNLEVVECYERESPEKLAACAQKLAQLHVDAIVTMGTTATLAAQKATRTIPIVTSVGDPVAAGFARSVRAPGGNITGLTQNRAEIARKQIELLHMMRPRVSAVGMLWEPPFPGIEILMKPVIEAAREAAISTHDIPREVNGFGKSLEQMAKLNIDSAFSYGGIERADLEAAVRARVAIVSLGKDEVIQGALFCVEPDIGNTSAEVAPIIDKVLRGASPAGMPFQAPTRYVTVFNAKTAAALGIRLTPQLRLRIERLVE
jgi:putative ABC transport system substrate-binding protein